MVGIPRNPNGFWETISPQQIHRLLNGLILLCVIGIQEREPALEYFHSFASYDANVLIPEVNGFRFTSLVQYLLEHNPERWNESCKTLDRRYESNCARNTIGGKCVEW